MHHSSHNSPTRYSSSGLHSLEVEGRLAKGETKLEAHEVRISHLERTLQYVIYAVGAIATSKTGDLAEIIVSVLQRKT